VTVFLTTHYIEEADQLCDRVAMVRDGKIVVEGSPEKLKSSLRDETIVEVAFDRDTPNLESHLRAGPSVKEVSRQGDKYQVRAIDCGIAIQEIIHFVTSNRLQILSINTKQPSLEDVFIKHTGLDAVQLERMELLRTGKAGGHRR